MLDSCDRARRSSMRSLGIADPPSLFEVLEQKLTAEEKPDQTEMLAIVEALALAPPRLAVLRRMSDECLHEFAILHGAALSFRETKRIYE